MLNLNDHVTITRAEYDLLVIDAGSWRLLNTSPHVAEILDEWIEWDQRRTFRDTSNAISAAATGDAKRPTRPAVTRTPPSRAGRPATLRGTRLPDRAVGDPAPAHSVFCPTHNRSLGGAA